MSRFGGYQSFLPYDPRLQKLKSKNRKKYKKEKFLKKITADGKIKKKEARRMEKKGITERDLMRYDAKTFKRAQKAFDNRPGPVRDRSPAMEFRAFRPSSPSMSGVPQYSPLTISRGAGRVLDNYKPPAPPPPPAAPVKPAFEPYKPEEINTLIDKAIAETTPPPPPEPPPVPQFIYNQPSLVPGQAQFGPARIAIQRSNPFQRAGSLSSSLKINKTLNV